MTTNETQCTCDQRGDETTRHRLACRGGRPVEQPDALTRLDARLWEDDALRGLADHHKVVDLVSEARKEMEALRQELIAALNDKAALRATMQERIDSFSNKSSEALRMGQQQGRVELAQEILANARLSTIPLWLSQMLKGLVTEDAGQ